MLSLVQHGLAGASRQVFGDQHGRATFVDQQGYLLDVVAVLQRGSQAGQHHHPIGRQAGGIDRYRVVVGRDVREGEIAEEVADRCVDGGIELFEQYGHSTDERIGPIDDVVVVDVHVHLAEDRAEGIVKLQIERIGYRGAALGIGQFHVVFAADGDRQLVGRTGRGGYRLSVLIPLIADHIRQVGQTDRIGIAARMAAGGNGADVGRRLNLQFVAFGTATGSIDGHGIVYAGPARLNARADLAGVPHVGQACLRIVDFQG